MEALKLYDCDIGLTINGTVYDFTHVDEVSIEDPEMVNLVRGANAGNKTGLAFVEGSKEPKTITFTLVGMNKALHDLLKTVYASKGSTRLDAHIISREDGSNKMFNQCVLSQPPHQMTLNETPESLNILIILKSFDSTEERKT